MATVGVPDAVYGEEVVSYVVARPGARSTKLRCCAIAATGCRRSKRRSGSCLRLAAEDRARQARPAGARGAVDARTMKANPLRSSAFRKSPEHIAAVELVQSWTRERFRLAAEAPILVSQLTCTNEGCPPLQTVVAFWTEEGDRHHFKVLKPMESIAPLISRSNGSTTRFSPRASAELARGVAEHIRVCCYCLNPTTKCARSIPATARLRSSPSRCRCPPPQSPPAG